MYPRQRLFRAVRWARRLCWLCVGLLVFGFFNCYSAAIPLSEAAVIRVEKEPRLPDTASEEERKEHVETRSLLWGGAYSGTNVTTHATALFIGLPVTVLLIVAAVFLSRALSLLRQGV